MAATLLAVNLTRDYRNALRAQAARVAGLIALAYQRMDPGSIDASLRLALPQIAAAIVGGQGNAAAQSYTYLTGFIAAELKVPVSSIEAPAADLSWLIGRTIKGHTVEHAVGFQAVYAKKLILRGRTAEEALAASLRNCQSLGRSELYRAAGESVREHGRVSPYVTRYRRVTQTESCDFCQMLAGRGAVYRLETSAFRSHRNCRCTAEPVVRMPRRQPTPALHHVA